MATRSSLLLDAWLQLLSCKNIVAIPFQKSTTLSSLFIVIFIRGKRGKADTFMFSQNKNSQKKVFLLNS